MSWVEETDLCVIIVFNIAYQFMTKCSLDTYLVFSCRQCKLLYNFLFMTLSSSLNAAFEVHLRKIAAGTRSFTFGFYRIGTTYKFRFGWADIYFTTALSQLKAFLLILPYTLLRIRFNEIYRQIPEENFLPEGSHNEIALMEFRKLRFPGKKIEQIRLKVLFL